MKCIKCGKEATHIVPDDLCALHWAEWFAKNNEGDDELTPEQEEDYLREVIENMKNLTFIFLKNSLPSVDGKYTIDAGTAGYVAETQEDYSILEFSLMDGDDIVFPQCKAIDDDFVIDDEHMNKVKKSFSSE